MKKLLLTLIVSIAFCGSIFAQYHSDEYESHWIDQFDVTVYNPYQESDAVVPFFQINGEYITLNDNFGAMELGAFIDGECRGHSFLVDDGEEYPITEISVYRMRADSGQEISFKLFDHANNVEYNCTSTLLNGQDYIQIYYGDYENAVVLNFIPDNNGYTLVIDPYEGEKDHYYLIASPVGAIAATDVDGLTDPEFDFFSFNQGAELEWINLKAEVEQFELQPGVGYLYANNTGNDLTFNGTPITEGTFEVELTYAEAAAGLDFPDWNLVGNPFEVSATLNQPFYSMDGGAFVSNVEGATLPAMNGAFVVGSAEVTTVIFTRDAGNKAPMLALNLTNSGKLVDRAIVSFGKGRQLPKLQLFTSSKVYIPQDGKDFAVVTSDGIGSMPVNFKAEKNGTYSFAVSNENVQFNYLHLIDHLTGADVDLLATPSYSFDARISDYASRFQLVFATGNNNDDSFACYYNGSIIISNEGNATLNIVDVLGRTISSQNINGSENVNINAKAGVYTLQLIQGENVKTQKIVVK